MRFDNCIGIDSVEDVMKHKTYSFTVMKTVDGFEATIPKLAVTVKGSTFDEAALEAERALATWLMERDQAKRAKRKKR